MIITTEPLLSPKGDVWETSTEIPYCYSIITWIWVVLLIGSKFASTNQNHSKKLETCSWKALLTKVLINTFLMWNLTGSLYHHFVFYSKWNWQNGEFWKVLVKLSMIFFSYMYAAKLFIKLSTLIIFFKAAFFNQNRSGK